MTIDELKETGRLARKIVNKTEKLVDMKARVRSDGEFHDAAERRIATLEAEICDLCDAHRRARRRAVKFIDAACDSRIRQILSYRFLRGMSWGAVAAMLGHEGGGSAERKAAVRYIEEQARGKEKK